MNIFIKTLALFLAILISPLVAFAIAVVTFFLSMTGFIVGAAQSLGIKAPPEPPEEELGVWEKYAKRLEEKAKDN